MTLALPCAVLSESSHEPIPINGEGGPEAEPFDVLVQGLLHRYEIPGAALAVSYGGKLVLSRGYGWADLEAKRAVSPDSIFRIASVSKPLTAVACLKLVEEGRLRLEDKAFDLLKLKCRRDPRMRDITVRQLLLHAAGWDRDASFDPMFHFGLAAPERIINEMLDRRLDFAPGSRHAYSNFGYCVLGRIIEKVTGLSYEEFVRRRVLEAMGIASMHIGARRGDDEHEVHYYGGGGYNLLPDVMDAHGGWVGSATDLVRFADATQGRGTKAFLRAETIKAMTARPRPPLWVGTRHWYGLGWSVVPAGGGVNCSHGGAMPGTTALLVSTHKGFTWAVLFNKMPPNPGKFLIEVDRGLWEASRSLVQAPDTSVAPNSQGPPPAASARRIGLN